MYRVILLGLMISACSSTDPETVSGNPSGPPPSGSIPGGGSGELDGGVDGGVDGGEPAGACDNESDLAVIEDGSALRNATRYCSFVECASLAGGSLPGGGDAFSRCVATCITMRLPDLSSECAACYGRLEQCGDAAFCRGRCQNNLCVPLCLDCLTEAECISAFEECRGLPGSGCEP